jgi:hypothetical protein
VDDLAKSACMFLSGASEFFITLGAFDIAFTLVFPIMVAICPKIYARCDIAY